MRDFAPRLARVRRRLVLPSAGQVAAADLRVIADTVLPAWPTAPFADVARDLEQAEARIAHAQLCLARRHFEQAAAAAREAIALAPFDLRAHRALALALAARQAHSRTVPRRREAAGALTDPQGLAAQGLSLLRAGDLYAAERALRVADRFEPGQEHLCVWRADALIRLGDYREARDVLRDLVARPTRDPHVHAKLAYALMKLGELAAAEASLRTAIGMDASVEGFRVCLADILLGKGKADEALAVLRDVIAIPTRDPHIHARVGHILVQRGDLPGAEAAFRNAAEMDAAVESFPAALADVLQRQGRHHDAIAILQELIARPTRDPHIHARYGQLLLQTGDLAGAEAALRIATELEPGNDGFHNALANVHNRRGDRAAALAILRRLVARPTSDPHIHAHLGHVLAQDDDLAGAEAAFARAARIAPGVDGFRGAEAAIIDRRGRHGEALTILQDLVARPTRDPHIHAGLGHILARNGDLDGAETAFRAAVSLEPRAEGFSVSLADILFRQGRREAAVDLLRGFAAKPTDDPHVHELLGKFLSQMGELGEAERTYREAIERDANVAGFHLGLAEVLERQGRPAEAICLLQQAGRTLRDARIHARLGRLLGEERDLGAAAAAWREAVALAPDDAQFAAALEKITLRLPSIPPAAPAIVAPDRQHAPHTWKLLRRALGVE